MDRNNHDYVLFIDEAGDDGLKRMKPIDANDSSEWLVIAGLAENAPRALMAFPLQDISQSLPRRLHDAVTY